MRHPFYKGVLLGSVVAIVVLMASTALAGSGVGAVFSLGKVNKVNRTSYLSGTTSKKMLQVTNKGTGPALGLTVRAGRPPLTVNSTARVRRLNADMVDGFHASDLRKVLTVRRDVANYEAVDLLTLPGLVTVQTDNFEDDLTIAFHRLSQDDLYLDKPGFLASPFTIASGGYVAFSGNPAGGPLSGTAAYEHHYTLWSATKSATIDVFMSRYPDQDSITVILEATLVQ